MIYAVYMPSFLKRTAFFYFIRLTNIFTLLYNYKDQNLRYVAACGVTSEKGKRGGA